MRRSNFFFIVFAVFLTALGLAKVGSAHAAAYQEISPAQQLPTAGFVSNTQLYSLRQTLTGQYAYSSYTYAPSILLSDGGSQSLRPLFRPSNNWLDTELMFATRVLNEERFTASMLWGGSTGQDAQKMYVQPSARVGLFMAAAPLDNLLITAKFSTVVAGGRQIERSCSANYGEIGGTQAVKCSMASSVMAPSDTLKYMTNTQSREQILAQVAMKWFF